MTQQPIENGESFEIMVAEPKDEQISLFFQLSLLPDETATQIKSSKKSKISNVLEA